MLTWKEKGGFMSEKSRFYVAAVIYLWSNQKNKNDRGEGFVLAFS